METPRYITLEVEKLENIIINSINKVYGSHIGYITKQLKEALIENSLTKELENHIQKFPYQQLEDAVKQFHVPDIREQFLNKDNNDTK